MTTGKWVGGGGPRYSFGMQCEGRIMTRRKWLWATVVGLPAVVVGGLAYANHSHNRTYTCPLTGEELPCPKCCPLNGATGQTQKAEGFTCPVTGEQLPCDTECH